MHVRRRVLRDLLLLLHRWWRDVLLLLLLRRWCGAGLPCARHAEGVADTRLALRGGSSAGATGRLQLLWLLRLGGRGLLILDWHGRLRLHWGCLRLLDLPSLGHLLLLLLLLHYLLLLLLDHLLLLLMLLLLTIRICHSVYRDVSMRIKGNTNAVRCSSAVLSRTLVARVDAAAAWWSGRGRRYAPGSGTLVTEGWATGTPIGADASVSFSANWALQMAAVAMGRRSCELRRVEARATAVGPAPTLTWEALLVRFDDSVHDGCGCLWRRLHECGGWRRRRSGA